MKSVSRFVVLVLIVAGVALAEESVTWSTINPGQGRAATLGYTVTVSFRLTLEDGQLIQETTPKTPLSFELGSETVIPGLSQGIQGMKRGESRNIRIPPSLAYGAQGRGPIPPNAVLLFEVTLLDHIAPSLSEQFLDEEFLAARHANDLSKPAVFEYLIRDFFTKPWRYPDGHIRIWESAGKVTVLAILLLLMSWFGRRKGAWL